MSLGTLGGFLSGYGLVIATILLSTDDFGTFVNIPSLLVVFGGTLTSTFISYEAKACMEALKEGVGILKTHKEGQTVLKNEVGRIIRWGYIVQKNGLQGLEADAEGAAKQDAFLSFGIDLVVTGYTGEEVRMILSANIEAASERDKAKSDILKMMGGASPAFGMLGTLIGLIVMLGNMGGDPSAVGPGMAVALITTLYGVLFARLLFMPAGAKVAARADVARFNKYLIAEGLGLLAERKSPRYIQDKMNSYLDPSDHYSIDRDMTDKP
jgi:chemotaxis protein MotA